MTSLRPVACVSLPELPLQLLLRKHPDWDRRPVALVVEERPEEPLVMLNDLSRRACLRTGMRFGVAKSLVPELRVGAVSELEIEQASCEMVKDLQTFSPHVERDPARPGVFYVDPTGLDHLYGGESSWSRSVYRFLRGRGYQVSLVLGHGRMFSYAVAQVVRGVKVLDAGQSRTQAHLVPLDRLGMKPKLRDGLERLGLSRLGDLERFGVDALTTRFGEQAREWCRVAQGHEVLPLCAEPHAEAVRAQVPIEPPDTDVARLCFALKRGLDQVFEQLVHRGESAGAVWVTFKFERGGQHRERLEPARATREASLWLELLRLRLSSLSLAGLVEEVILEVEGVRAKPGQMALFATGRDVDAGDRALARLRAMYGEQSVCSAELCEGHLPEAKFRWRPMTKLEPASPDAQRLDAQAEVPLVRRMLPRPVAMQARLEDPAAVQTDCKPYTAILREGRERLRLTGPYRVSGGWWVREVARDYYYAQRESGELQWVFFDHAREGWFLHAAVD